MLEPVIADSAALPRPRADVMVSPGSTPPQPEISALHRALANPGLVAIVTFLVAAPIAFAVPRVLPGEGVQSAGFPLACGGAAGAILLMFGLRRASAWLCGAVAGIAGAWVVMILATAMRGTPFPMYGFIGDAGRIAAMATRYSVTAGSADPWVRGTTGDYPILFPWLIGRTSALLGEPAWRLIGDFEVLFTGACVVGGFALWQRLVKPWLALAISVLVFAFLPFAIVAKSYEALTLMVFVPWVVLTFGNPPRGRLHWLAAGLIGGFVVLAYYGWLVLGGIGVLLIAYMTWKREPDRRAYLLHLLKVGAVALLVSSWFVVPLFLAQLKSGGANVSDLYGSSSLLDAAFPFLELSWSGLIQLTGLIGLIWLRGRVWWAWPLLAMVIGAYVFRGIGALAFVLTNHTLVAHYTPRLYTSVLIAAAVLTIAHVTPPALERLSVTPPRGALALTLAVLIGWTGYTFTIDWMPGLWGRYKDYAERAYREPMPDGKYVADYPNPTAWFPVEPIQRSVEKVLGPQANPVVLSIDERIWAYLPWYGYTGTSTAIGSLSDPFHRLAEVQRLAQISDPAAFARESAHTKYGEIDVFILNKTPDGTWTWTYEFGFGQKPAVVTFTPRQFGGADWVVADNLPQNVVVATRKP